MAYPPGWHRGEDAIHTKLGYDKVDNAVDLYEVIKLESPVLANVLLEGENRPWVSARVGEDGIYRLSGAEYARSGSHFVGERSFYESAEDSQSSPLFASVGIGVSTRTKNKFAAGN
ncbi:hypothetical protein CPC08DRAFT_347615 [Agrocybe pediades]|nr:hypothetical protein CPC08DRAFT_347615 [Agrocybe pediades]